VAGSFVAAGAAGGKKSQTDKKPAQDSHKQDFFFFTFPFNHEKEKQAVRNARRRRF